MRISQVGVIALMMIIAASLAPAGADDKTATVRVKVTVGEQAEVASAGDIELKASPAATGSTTINAVANFDFDLYFEWLPDSEWQNCPATLDPVSTTRLAGLGQRAVELSLNAEPDSTGGVEWGSSPAGSASETDTVTVKYGSEDCGHIMITLCPAL